MLTFVSFMECINAPSRECLTSPAFLAPMALFVLLVYVGFMSRRQNLFAFRKLRRLTLVISAWALAAVLAVIAAFFVFNPNPILGAEASAPAETLWVIAISLFGGAVALMAGALGLALGGWIAKRRPAPALNLVIAIDGPAASGKGTLAKRIARHFGLPYLDTGLLYRAVARDVAARGASLDDAAAALAAAKALDARTLGDPALRGPAAGDAASLVARISAVRAALLDYQRSFASAPGGAVLDGRDIGSVVCPKADIKIFVTASAEERARRRHEEHIGRGENTPYETVLADIVCRDARDAGREIAPLEPAPDAVRLDTTSMNADEAFAAALGVVRGSRR